MPLYFFHRTDGEFDPDQEGTDLPDLEAARMEAVRFAAQTVKDRPDKVWEGGSFRVEVSDDANTLLCTAIVLAIDTPVVRGWTGRAPA